MREVSISWFNPIINFGEVRFRTRLPLKNCKCNRVPGFYAEVKKIY